MKSQLLRSVRLTFVFLLAQLLVFSSLPPAYGQITTGTILGTIKDALDSVVPGGTITIKNTNTGLTRSVISDDSGNYIIPLLPVGVYEVTAELPGFKKTVVSGIVLQVDQKARVDISMEVGEITNTVEVQGEVSLMKTERADVGMMVDTQKVVDLPLKGRDFTNLNLLDSGTAQRSNHRNAIIKWLNVPFSYNGSSPDGNQFLVDGISIQDPVFIYATFKLSIDAIQEFKQAASQYSAEFGHGSGAQVNAITKSGTNNFHGNLFWFLRNDAVNARNFFDAPGQDLPEYKLNQYGGTFGGPIKKDKTFFFFSYEGARIRKGLTKLYNVPPIAMRNGNFVGSQPIYDPNTTKPDPARPGQFIRDPFPGNVIPANRIDPVAKRALDALFPLPNRPGVSANLLASPVERVDEDQFTGRVDHHFNPQNSIYGRFSMTQPRRQILSFSQLPNFFEKYNHPVKNAVISYTRVFSPVALNEFKVGFQQFIQIHHDVNADKDIDKELGIFRLDSYPGETVFGGPPTINIAGFNVTAGITNKPNDRTGNVPTVQDNFSFTRGKHTIGAGMDLRQRQQNHSGNQPAPQGVFAFTARFTTLPGVTRTGNAMADYLLGYPTQTQGGIGQGFRNYRGNDLGFYIQDDWQAHPNLTLNLGLRYEYFGPWYEIRNRLYFFDLKTAEVVSTDEFVKRGYPRSSYFGDKKDFAPRLGLAWRPFGNNRTVVRLGYGIYHFRGQGYYQPFAHNPGPETKRFSFNADPIFPDLTLANGFPIAKASQSLTVTVQQPEWKTPYNKEWSLFVQRELISNLTLEVGYLGNRGIGLMTGRDHNQPDPGSSSIISRRTYPAFTSVNVLETWGDSWYHSLKVNAERRYQGGLSFRASWTFSKALDTGGVGSYGESLPTIKRSWYNAGANRGRTQFDARNRISLSYNWDLPFGSGKQFLAGAAGFWKELVTGWQLNGITIIQDGTPVDTRLSSDNANTGGNGADDMPDLVGDPNKGAPRSPEQFFNTSAFALPKRFTWGNAGRNIIDAPGTINSDVSLFKNIDLTERQKLQIRLEVFNIFNHPNFDPPNTVFGTAPFGRINSAGDGRELQFALKYSF